MAHHAMNCVNMFDPQYHGPDGGIATYPDTTFICNTSTTPPANTHLMTYANGGGYAETIFIPDQLVDFSGAGATITWKVSSLKESGRDWWDVTVTPWGDNLVGHALLFLSTDANGCPTYDPMAPPVDFAGAVPRNGLSFSQTLDPTPKFVGRVFGSGQKPDFCSNSLSGEWRDLGCDPTYNLCLTPSSVRRDKYELILSRNRVILNLYFQSASPPADTLPPFGSCPLGDTDPSHFCKAALADQTFTTPLTWTSGILAFGHHSYNPAKSGGGWGPSGSDATICGPGEGCGGIGQSLCCGPAPSGNGRPCCKAGTWHWSDLSISNAVPFTIIQGTQRWVSPTTSPTVTFPRASGAGAFLRFEGRSLYPNPIQYSVDGGATWVNAVKRPMAATLPPQDAFYLPFENYWTPLPVGVTSIQLRGTNGYGTDTNMPWWVRDITVWQP
jgi:hypothetical protein